MHESQMRDERCEYHKHLGHREVVAQACARAAAEREICIGGWTLVRDEALRSEAVWVRPKTAITLCQPWAEQHDGTGGNCEATNSVWPGSEACKPRRRRV